MSRHALTVERVGPLALLQDLGRPGHAHLGVSPSGAADRGSLRTANRLVGNADGALAVEVLAGGLALRASADVTVAVTGAPLPVQVDGRAVDFCAPAFVPAGSLLRLGTPVTGLRSYLAVRGGLAAEQVFGSGSRDTLSGIGPEPLAVGSALHVADADPVAAPRSSDVPRLHGASPGGLVVRAVPGPRDDWFGPPGARVLTGVSWTVAGDSDRVGVRLSGPVVERHRREELASEGVLRGAVQVPPSGQPLVFLADHPTTGGYPVVAVVVEEDCDLLAQARPGEGVRVELVRGPELG
ncbi:5-oxoprolinase subunit C family protein [Oryzihumus sp.]